jgi:hypothetical protein
MRILIVSPYFPPQAAVASLRAHSFATAWTSAGHDVSVLTTVKRPDQEGWAMEVRGFHVEEIAYRSPWVLEPLRRAYKRDEARGREAGAAPANGRQIVMRRLRRLRDDLGIFASVRMPDLTDFWVRPAVAWAREAGPWDVVVSTAGPYTAHLVALALRRGGDTRAWAADFRDLWVDNHLHRGLFPFTWREGALEKQCLDEADAVVTVSEPLAEALRAKTSAPVSVVLNGFDPDELRDLPPERILPDDGLVRLVFTGSLYAAGQDTGPLLRALATARRADGEAATRLRLTVAGASAEAWRHDATRAGVADAVEARGVVPREDARRMQRDADALLLVDFEANVAGALTSKVFEYLSVAPPILVVGGRDDTPIARLLAPTGRALHLGRDETAIADALVRLARREPVLDAAPDPAAIEDYTRARQAAHLLATLDDLVSAKRVD